MPASVRTGLLTICLLALLVLQRGRARADDAVQPTPSPPPVGHLEEPQDQPLPGPAPAPALGVRPRAVYERNGYVSVQVNVTTFGDNIVGDAANEPSIAVDPTNPNHIAIGWRQFNNVGSNFRQAGMAYSADGGQTWTYRGPLDAGVFRSDPVLASSADGTFYYYSLTSDFLCQMFVSYDGGSSWTDPIQAFGGDKAWMTIDTTTGMGQGNIYCSWSNAAGCCSNNIFTRSTDGGLTWMQPITIPYSPRWGTLAVGQDGAVYVVGQAGSSSAPLVRSSNAQNGAVTPTWDLARLVYMGGATRASTGPNPGGLLGQMWVATNPPNGPNGDNVYLLGSVDPPGTDPLDVMFARSTDRGASWSAPVRVNDDPPFATAWQWFGTISVAPIGRIDVVWLDTRDDATVTYSELYYTCSRDGGLTWQPSIAISPPFNHFLGYPNQNKMGDYFDMVSDDYGADLAYAATLNGEQDVYFVRIPAMDCNGNGVDDTQDIAGGTSEDCNNDDLPDECQFDCNQTGQPGDCDIDDGISFDCNGNRIPDECETDCNNDGLADECAVAAQPTDQLVCPGGDAVFTVTASDPSFTFQWKLNGAPLVDGGGISGATTDTLTISNVRVADEGSTVTCQISDGCLLAESVPASISIYQLGTITQQPVPTKQACADADVSLSITVSGASPPPAYQWYENGLPLMTGGRYSGVHSNALFINDVTPADTGNTYTCEVSNPCASLVSDASVLEVITPVIQQQPEDACGEIGGTVVLSATATAPAQLYYQWRMGSIVVGSGSTLTLDALEEADEGLYRVLAFTLNPTCIEESNEVTVQVGDCPVCAPPGDVDGDGDFDLADMQGVMLCFGHSVVADPSCACANVDATDWVVNIDDWTALDAAATGPTD